MDLCKYRYVWWGTCGQLEEQDHLQMRGLRPNLERHLQDQRNKSAAHTAQTLEGLESRVQGLATLNWYIKMVFSGSDFVA